MKGVPENNRHISVFSGSLACDAYKIVQLSPCRVVGYEFVGIRSVSAPTCYASAVTGCRCTFRIQHANIFFFIQSMVMFT